MPKQDHFPEVYTRLKSILTPYASRLVTVVDDADHYYLNAPKPHPQRPHAPLFFGAVQIHKQYVSYYLMPVYVKPELLASISAPLRKRMQGKSCFNFTAIDETLLAELAALTALGFALYEQNAWV